MRHPKYTKNIKLNNEPVRYWLNIPKELSAHKDAIQAEAEQKVCDMIDDECFQGVIHIPSENGIIVSGYWIHATDGSVKIAEFIDHAVKITLEAAKSNVSDSTKPMASSVSIVELINDWEGLIEELISDWEDGTY